MRWLVYIALAAIGLALITVACTDEESGGNDTTTRRSAPLGRDSLEEVAYKLAVINGHCFADSAADALDQQSPYGCDDALEFHGIIRRLGQKCADSEPETLGNQLVRGHQIVHENGWPDVGLLELGHAWDTSTSPGLGLTCAETLATLIATVYP